MNTRNPLRSFSSRISSGVLAAAIGIGLGIQPVQAEDAKYYPGSNCKPTSVLSASKIWYGRNGDATNDSTATAYVTCPLLRDSTTRHWKYLRFVFDDRHPTQDIRCTLGFVDRGGVVRQTKSFRSVNSGVQTRGISRSSSGGGLGASASAFEAQHAIYAVNCAIPGKSSVRSFVGSSILRYEFFEDS